MTLKDINYSIDMYGTSAITTNTYQTVFTGDEDSVQLKFSISDEEDLTGATALIHLYFGDSSHIERVCTPITGGFQYTLTGTENDHAGITRVDIYITKAGAKFTRAGYKFRIDKSLEASAPLVEYAVDTVDTVVKEAGDWLLQAQTDFGTAQGTRAAEWVADNDTRADDFNAAQTSRANSFSASEAARTSTFNANETGRSNTFTVNENARQEAAEANQAQSANDHSTASADHDTAVADSSLASSDHATATTDHGTAVVDHSTASADHTASLADQAIVDGLQDQFNEVIANATVDSEVINARQGSATLSQNILSVKQQLEQIVPYDNQLDFVAMVENYMPIYSVMKFKRTAENTYQVICSDDISKYIAYQFIKDVNDDFIKIDSCFTGAAHTQTDKDFDTIVTGVWNTASTAHYTTEVGATATFTLQGEILKAYVNTESRGGLWEIVIDGDTANKKYVSCYNPTTKAQEIEFARGLAPGVDHTVIFTFLGNDPNHAPSSTPSRGYLINNPANVTMGCVTGYTEIGALDKIIFASASNKEMAFSTTYAGSTAWIPEHSTIGSAFANKPSEFYLDGKKINIELFAINAMVDINDFQLLQKINGRVNGTNVLYITTTHKLDKTGILNFGATARAVLDNVVLNAGYPLMMPANYNYANEFITGILNTQVNTGDETEVAYPAEQDKVFSGAIISQTNKNIIGAGTLLYPKKSYRLGATAGKPTDKDLFLWHRATTPKMYFKAIEGLTLMTDDMYMWGFKMVIADIENIYYLLKHTV